MEGVYNIAQPSFAFPDELRNNHATPSVLGIETELVIVTPYIGTSVVFDPMNSFFVF